MRSQNVEVRIRMGRVDNCGGYPVTPEKTRPETIGLIRDSAVDKQGELLVLVLGL